MGDIKQIVLPVPYGIINQVNVHLILGKKITLIDTGPDSTEARAKLLHGLAQFGMQLSDIEQIILTHIHIDHCGQLQFLMEQTKAKVYVHAQGLASFYSQGKPLELNRQEEYMHACFAEWGIHQSIQMWNRFYEHPVDTTRINPLEHGERIVAGDRQWQVHHTPGHSQLDICLLDLETGDFLAGDHILPGAIPLSFLEAPFPDDQKRPQALLNNIKSLKSTLELPINRIYPGHGKPFIGHQEWIANRLKKVESRCAQLLKEIRQGHDTIYDLCRVVYPSVEQKYFFMTLSDVIGHLDILFQQKRVVLIDQGKIRLNN